MVDGGDESSDEDDDDSEEGESSEEEEPKVIGSIYSALYLSHERSMFAHSFWEDF